MAIFLNKVFFINGDLHVDYNSISYVIHYLHIVNLMAIILANEPASHTLPISFDLTYILCMSVLTSITDFVFISYMFRASHLSF